MPQKPGKIKILLINSNIELIFAFENWLKDEGYDIRSVQVVDLKLGQLDIRKILKEYSPDIVLYDISIPYEDNWRYFQHLNEDKETNKYPYVLTTTNKKALDTLVGKNSAYEVIGKPYDLKEITKLINFKARSKSR